MKYFYILFLSIISFTFTSCEICIGPVCEGRIIYDDIELPKDDNSDSGGGSGSSAPDPVTDLSATSPYSNQVDLSWTAITGSDNYTIHFSTDNSSFSAIVPDVTGTTYSHTGRTASTTYYYYVIANNSTGPSTQSNTASITTSGAPTVTLTATASVAEGNSGTKSQTITATQSATSTTNTTVNLSTSGTASDNGTDYTLDNSTILITAGSTTGTTSVTIVGDRIQENNETIVVDIDNVTGGDNATESGTQQETITITNDDIAGFSFTISTNNTVTESGAGDSFDVELDTEPTANVTVTITDNDSSEILVSPTTLVFSSGNYSTAQTINLTAVEDNATDGNQTVTITLAGSSVDSFYNGAAAQTIATVVDSGNEPPSVPVSNLSATAVSTTQIDLSWSASANTDNYTVYFSTDNSSFSAISPVVTSTSYSHTGITPGTTYYYYLISNNAYGVSGQSNRANDTTTSILVDLSADITSVTEGDTGSQTITLTATQSQTATTNTTVTLSASTAPADAAISTGTANIDKDYAFVSSTITITAGSLTGTTTLNVYGDYLDEDNETIYINMSGVSGGDGASENGTQTANISIVDDDNTEFKYSILGGDSVATEGGSGITYYITLNLYLDSRPDGNVLVDFSLEDSTQLSLLDGPTLTFTPSNHMNTQVVRVAAVDDLYDDGNVTSKVYIDPNGGTADTTGYASLSQKSKNITAEDNDAPGPVLDNVTAGIQQNYISWQAFAGEDGGYRLYYRTTDDQHTGSDSYITIGTGITEYYHSGLDSGLTYYYRVTAFVSAAESSMSNSLNGVPTTPWPGCTSTGPSASPSDPTLEVHYPFENNGEDLLDKNANNVYDLTNVHPSNTTFNYVAGCAGGKALYIDSTSGIYATSAFTSSAVGGNLNSGNFTISFMAVADADMETNSSALNTGFKDLHSPFGSYATKSQFDIGNSDQIRFRSPSSNTGDPSALTQNTWHHIVATSNSGQDAVLYKDGVVVDSTNTGNFDADFFGLAIGINRDEGWTNRFWKGYIDDVRVYSETKSVDQVRTICMEYDGCSYIPETPTLTATARASSIYLSWNLPTGADNVTIYWRESTGFEGSPTAPTASNNVINAVDNQTSYFLANLDVTNYHHFVILANNRNGSSSPSSVAATANVQPLNARFRSTSINGNTLVYINRDNELWVRGNNWSPSEGGNAEIYFSPRNSNFGEQNSVHADSISNASVVGAGSNKISALLDNGSVYHFHTNNSSLFWDSYNTETTPTNIPGGTTIVDMRHSLKAVYYLLSDGTILAKGRNHVGQLGNGTTTDETGSTGVFVSGINTATQIAVGIQHACALLSNGQVWCWGDGDKGELGDGLDRDSSTPVQVSLPTNTATMIDGTYNDTFALMSDGTVYGWGENRSGKIKCSTDNSQVLSPERVSGLSNIIDIAVGYETVHLLEDDDNDGRGTLYTCGRANKNYDQTNNAAFRFWNDNNGDINYISSYNGVGNAIKADEYNNRLIQIDGDRYSLLLIRDDLTLMGIGQSQHKQFSITDNNGANRMVIFDDNLQPIESTNPID